MEKIIFIVVAVCLWQCMAFSSVSNSTEWSFFLLVQRWPYSTCQIVNVSGHPCIIPKIVDGWTIHGLWPNGISSYPTFCHDWKFNESKVKDLEAILLKTWPNLYANETFDSLWKHEYEKHGTCAADVRGFEKQHDYFARTLEMLPKYDVQRLLEEKGIYPRKRGYEMGEIINAITASYNRVVCPGCGHVKGVGQVLSQSYVCIDRYTLQQIDCPSCEKPCSKDAPVLYQPIR